MKVITALFVTLLTLAVPAHAKSPDEVAVGSTLRNLPMKGLNGPARKVLDFKGKPLIINVWASWCAPCVREMPVLEAFYQEHRAKGWNMLGIAVDQPAAALRFLQQHPVSFPMAILPESNTELMRKLGNTAAALPFSLQFDHAGNVVERHVGELSAQELQRWFDTTKPQ